MGKECLLPGRKRGLITKTILNQTWGVEKVGEEHGDGMFDRGRESPLFGQLLLGYVTHRNRYHGEGRGGCKRERKFE